MAFVYTGEKVDLGFGRGWLARPAAESIWRIDRQIGHALQITEAGRDYATQMRHWLNYQRNGYPIALHPDTPSLHQKGNAVDSNEAQRILRIMEENGWRRTVYRWVNGVWTLVEAWHFEHFAHLDKRINEGSAAAGGSGTFIPKEWDEMATEAQIRAVVASEVAKIEARSGVSIFQTVRGDGSVEAYIGAPGIEPIRLTSPTVRDILKRYLESGAHGSYDTFNSAEHNIIAEWLVKLAPRQVDPPKA